MCSRKKRSLFLVLLVFMISFAACSPNGKKTGSSPNGAENENSFVPAGVTQGDEEEQVLIVKSIHGGEDWEQTVEGRLAIAFNKTHPGKKVIIEELPGGYEFDGSTWAYETALATELMSGEADYLIDVFNLNPAKYASSGLFWDLYEWMEKDPDFHKEDYYENIFTAMEFDGHLYTLPTMFGMTAVYLNKSITDSIHLEFTPLDLINYKDILEIHREAVGQGLMSANEPILFHDECPAGFMFLGSELKSYVDWENRSSHFSDPAFIEYLKETKEIPAGGKMEDGTRGMSCGERSFASALAEGKEHALFTTQPLELSTWSSEGFTSTRVELVGPLILSSAGGEVTADTSFRIMVPKSCKNIELAWEFLKFCMMPVENPGVRPRTEVEKKTTNSDALDICFGAFPVNRQNMSAYAALYGFFGDESMDKWMPKLEKAITTIKSFGFGTANLEILMLDTLGQYYDSGLISAEECGKKMDELANVYLKE